MALTLLPAVDVRDGKAVRLRQGESGSETDYGSPLDAARTWVDAGAQWIHLVDLDAAFGTGDNRAQLRRIVAELGDAVNIEMSGGVRDDASLDAALEAGAARVNIGTAALENPEWTARVIAKYGDRVAVGLDVRGHTLAARGWVKEGHGFRRHLQARRPRGDQDARRSGCRLRHPGQIVVCGGVHPARGPCRRGGLTSGSFL